MRIDSNNWRAEAPELYKFNLTDPKAGEVMHFPETANGRRGFSLEVEAVDDTHAYLKYPGSDYTAVKIPRESLKQYRDDLMGKVDVPATSDIPEINAVARGEGKLLGHGDDGMAFDAGGKIVKVSSVVPFHPTNSVGQRTPEQAIEQARKQFETAKEMYQAGIPGIMRQSVRQIGDKVFTVRDKLEIPKTFTAEQIDQVRRSMDAMHAAGYALNDDIQVGIGKDGKVYHFDTGKAAKVAHKDDVRDDSSRFERFAEKHGHEPLPLRAKAAADAAEAEKNLALWAKKPSGPPPHLRKEYERYRRALEASMRAEGGGETKPAEVKAEAPAPQPAATTDPFAGATADHGPALAGIAPNNSAYVAGHLVRRMADGRYQIEGGRGFVTGTAAEIADRIRDSWRRQSGERTVALKALDRAAAHSDADPFSDPNAAATEAAARANVPDGARAVSADEATRGRVGVVRRDPDTGIARLVFDGGEEGRATDFEPLDARHSWRKPGGQTRPGAEPAAATTGDLFAEPEPAPTGTAAAPEQPGAAPDYSKFDALLRTSTDRAQAEQIARATGVPIRPEAAASLPAKGNYADWLRGTDPAALKAAAGSPAVDRAELLAAVQQVYGDAVHAEAKKKSKQGIADLLAGAKPLPKPGG